MINKDLKVTIWVANIVDDFIVNSIYNLLFPSNWLKFTENLLNLGWNIDLKASEIELVFHVNLLVVSIPATSSEEFSHKEDILIVISEKFNSIFIRDDLFLSSCEGG